MLGRYIEDPSNSVIHKTEQFMTTKHEGLKLWAFQVSQSYYFIDSLPDLYRISLLERPALQISFLRACLLKELSAFT